MKATQVTTPNILTSIHVPKAKKQKIMKNTNNKVPAAFKNVNFGKHYSIKKKVLQKHFETKGLEVCKKQVKNSQISFDTVYISFLPPKH